MLGETWASASPAHCCSLRGYETTLCLFLCYYTYLESLDVLNVEGKELLVGEMFWFNLGVKRFTVWRSRFELGFSHFYMAAMSWRL